MITEETLRFRAMELAVSFQGKLQDENALMDLAKRIYDFIILDLPEDTDDPF